MSDYDAYRDILSWKNKLMRIPDSREWQPTSIYIRAVWQRIGGVWRTGKQAEVAEIIGISLSTLKRYMTQEGSCPYSVQFMLESLAGMESSGTIFETRDAPAEIHNALYPFSATGSIQSSHTYIALTYHERKRIIDFAKSKTISISLIVADRYIAEHSKLNKKV